MFIHALVARRSRMMKKLEGVMMQGIRTLGMKDNKWLRLLTYVTGLVNQELLLQNEYLAAESLLLRAHLPARLRLSDAERSTLAEIGKRLGRKALAGVARVAGRRPHGLVPKVDRDQVAGLDKSPFQTAD